MDSVIIINP